MLNVQFKLLSIWCQIWSH